MSRSLLVVLAEDDAELRELMAQALWERGHRVVECADGHALLCRLGSALLGAEPTPDVVVSDDHMPGARGSQVMAGLHEPSNPWRLVLVTAYPDAEVRARARGLRARLVEKPFDANDLIEAVEGAAGASSPAA